MLGFAWDFKNPSGALFKLSAEHYPQNGSALWDPQNHQLDSSVSQLIPGIHACDAHPTIKPYSTRKNTENTRDGVHVEPISFGAWRSPRPGAGDPAGDRPATAPPRTWCASPKPKNRTSSVSFWATLFFVIFGGKTRTTKLFGFGRNLLLGESFLF